MSIKPLLEKIEKYRADIAAKKTAAREAAEANAVARMEPILKLIPDITEHKRYSQQIVYPTPNFPELEMAFEADKVFIRTNEDLGWLITALTPAKTQRTEKFGNPERAVKYLIAALFANTYDEVDELFLKALNEPGDNQPGGAGELSIEEIGGKSLGTVILHQPGDSPNCAKCHQKFQVGEQRFHFTYLHLKPDAPFPEPHLPTSPDNYEQRIAALCAICQKIVFPETGEISVGVKP